MASRTICSCFSHAPMGIRTRSNSLTLPCLLAGPSRYIATSEQPPSPYGQNKNRRQRITVTSNAGGFPRNRNPNKSPIVRILRDGTLSNTTDPIFTPLRLSTIFFKAPNRASKKPHEQDKKLPYVKITPKQVLDFTYPDVNGTTALLDIYLYSISVYFETTLKKEYYNMSDEDRIKVGEIMGHCWVRSTLIKFRKMFTDVEMDVIAKNYARYLTLMVQDEKLKSAGEGLYKQFEGFLTRYKEEKKNLKLDHWIHAAWSIMREELNKVGEKSEYDLSFVPPPKDAVTEALKELSQRRGMKEDAVIAGYESSVGEVIKAGLGEDDLPATPEKLDNMLGGFRTRGERGKAINLWTRVKEEINRDRNNILADPRERSKYLAKFVRYFSPKRRTGSEATESLKYQEEVLALIPKPYSPEIHYTLLKGKVPSVELTESESTLLNPLSPEKEEDIGTGQARENRLNRMRHAWEEASNDDARDLKLYMLYMEGLGRLGDIKGLGEVWDQLINDEKCKKRYFDPEGGSLFPPTQALNHMISCNLLRPSLGGPIALDLFNQACSPDTTIPPNIVTINTVLRHHARKADVPAMRSLLPLAEKLGLQPDIITYTTLVQGLLNAKDSEAAWKVLESMTKQGIEPNEVTMGLLISEAAKDGDRRGMKVAEELMQLMRKLEFKIGEIPWTSLINGYFKGGWDTDGWKCIERMREKGVKLNRVGFNIILRECGYRCRMEKGKGESLVYQMWKRMLEDRIEPNGDTYYIALNPLMKTARWSEADSIVKNMKESGFTPEQSALRGLVNKVRDRISR